MDIDERITALTMNLELMSREKADDWRKLQEQGREIHALLRTAEEHTKSLDNDAEHIRALVRIAEIHERPRPSGTASFPGEC